MEPQARLSATDPEPSVGTIVRDDCGIIWVKMHMSPCPWVRADVNGGDPESWVKIAGNYGPVTIIEWGPW